MGNYHNTAIVLKNKKDFDIAWDIVNESGKTDGGVSAQITSDFIVNFDIKYDMDWGLIRKVSKAVENEIKVFTYYDGDGGMTATTYSQGKRISQKEFYSDNVVYWRGLIYIFGEIDWSMLLGDSKELVIKSSLRYSWMVKVMIVDWEKQTFDVVAYYTIIAELPNLVKKYEASD